MEQCLTSKTGKTHEKNSEVRGGGGGGGLGQKLYFSPFSQVCIISFP